MGIVVLAIIGEPYSRQRGTKIVLMVLFWCADHSTIKHVQLSCAAGKINEMTGPY